MPLLFLSKMTSEEQVQKYEIFHTDDPDLGRASDYSCRDYRNFALIATSSSPICTCDGHLQLVNKNALHHNTFSKLYARNEVLLKISKLLENIKQY